MKVYVTTSIPYVNAKPHIGHALELVQADAIARYSRAIGNETVFQTGTDENAYTNVVAAKELGIPAQEFVDENSKRFKQLIDLLHISADTFIRTTDSKHVAGVTEFWGRIQPSDIYKNAYSGLYCTGCEDFLLEKDLVNGACPDHRTKPQIVEEENYFFRLSEYQREIEQLISTRKLSVVPETRRNEVLAFLKGGLQDISISRDARRMSGWGIPVPGDRGQTIYVWIDALINYVTGQGFGTSGDWQEIWNTNTRKIHVIGKDVWKFHAIYWPAILLSAGIPVPDEIVVHGFLTAEGQKISKSLGNVIDPFQCAALHGSDAVRYYLLTLPPFEDADYSKAQQEQVYTADLANGIGNLTSRITTLCRKAGIDDIENGRQHPSGAEYASHISGYRFSKALHCIRDEIASLNREIDKTRPWENLDAGATGQSIKQWAGRLRAIAFQLRPFLPDAAPKIIENLSGDSVEKPEPLFPRR